jgi:hypothetical protein
MMTCRRLRRGTIEDVVALAPSDIVEEQVQAGENVGETSAANDKFEVDLERTILMIEEQTNVVLITLMVGWENANDDVGPHAHIDGDDILNFTYYYNLLPNL